jgi:hypothetical protein
MTQGRRKKSKVRSAKTARLEAAGKNVSKASRKKSAANRAPKVSPTGKTNATSTKAARTTSIKGKSSKRAAANAVAVNDAGKSKKPAKREKVASGHASEGARGAEGDATVPSGANPNVLKSASSKQTKKLRPPSPRRPVQLGLGFDDTQDALAVLQQQNKRLMLKIGQRRASLMLLRQLSDELMQEASQRVLPYREELKALTRELLDLESSVLSADTLVGRDRDKVRLVFHELLKGLPQDELDAEPDEPEAVKRVAVEPSSETAPDLRASGDVSASSSSSPEVHDADPAAADLGSPPPGTTNEPEAAQPEARSADKPAGDQSGALRSLFKRLVIQWHPDRVRDDAQKAERTKLLKELTQAFEGGDLAKLVALEQTLALTKTSEHVAQDNPEKRAEQLRRANSELMKQLGELRANLDAVREDCPFTLDYRKKDPASVARDELDEFVLMNHMAVQRAEQTRDFVLSFAQGKMKLTEFLQGPRRSP